MQVQLLSLALFLFWNALEALEPSFTGSEALRGDQDPQRGSCSRRLWKEPEKAQRRQTFAQTATPLRPRNKSASESQKAEHRGALARLIRGLPSLRGRPQSPGRIQVVFFGNHDAGVAQEVLHDDRGRACRHHLAASR